MTDDTQVTPEEAEARRRVERARAVLLDAENASDVGGGTDELLFNAAEAEKAYDAALDAYRDAVRGSLREQCRAVFEAYVDARRAYREAEPFTEAHWNELSQFDRAFEAVYDFLHENPEIDVDDAIRRSDKERIAALESGIRGALIETNHYRSASAGTTDNGHTSPGLRANNILRALLTETHVATREGEASSRLADLETRLHEMSSGLHAHHNAIHLGLSNCRICWDAGNPEEHSIAALLAAPDAPRDEVK